MNAFQPFVMEHSMGKWENTVEYNLSESGVHPVKVRELLGGDTAEIDALLETELNYPQVNGIPALREHIAALYPGATPDEVLVTVGAAEANYIAVRAACSPGDDVAVMVPNYMQVWGVAKNHGCRVRTFTLDGDRGWALDADAFEEALTPETRLIAVCNPNNPTGRVLSEAEVQRVVAAAERRGAWILADEVYAGAERLAEQPTPSLYGRYDKVIAVGSLSKAYGLPGLRIGWAVAPRDMLEDMWYRHDYTAITTTVLANRLAAIALSPEVRPRLIERTRTFIRDGYPVLQRWLLAHGNTFSVVPPDAAAIAFVRYHLEVDSLTLAERLREEKSVLIVPGDHFSVGQHLRISFGLPEGYLSAGLERIHELVMELAQ